jgi:hypothetical protein
MKKIPVLQRRRGHEGQRSREMGLPGAHTGKT